MAGRIFKLRRSGGSGEMMIVFLLAAVALVAYGLYQQYHYSPFDRATKIVGADAYNYLILGLRGVGFIGAGICSALVGLGIGLYSMPRVAEVEEEES